MWYLVNKKIIRDTWNFSQNKFEKHFTIIFERKNKKGQKRPHKAFFIKKKYIFSKWTNTFVALNFILKSIIKKLAKISKR